MPTKIRIQLDHDGIRQLLTSDEMQEAVQDAAETIARIAGEGFEAKSLGPGHSRTVSVVRPVLHEAYVAQARENRLFRAVSECSS